jgi:hypothetical protein
MAKNANEKTKGMKPKKRQSGTVPQRPCGRPEITMIYAARRQGFGAATIKREMMLMTVYEVFRRRIREA